MMVMMQPDAVVVGIHWCQMTIAVMGIVGTRFPSAICQFDVAAYLVLQVEKAVLCASITSIQRRHHAKHGAQSHKA